MQGYNQYAVVAQACSWASSPDIGPAYPRCADTVPSRESQAVTAKAAAFIGLDAGKTVRLRELPVGALRSALAQTATMIAAGR
jgi:hypothetical protein